MNSPRSPRSLQRSQHGHTRPPAEVEVKTGSDRINQLSTPRYRLTNQNQQNTPNNSGTSYTLQNPNGDSSGGFGGYSSPRFLNHDQRTVYKSIDKMMTRIENHHLHPSVSPRSLISNNSNSAEQESANSSNSKKPLNFVPEIPTAVKLLASHKNEHGQLRNNSHRTGLFPEVNAHANAGVAGLILSDSKYLEDRDAKFGTKLQKHELCNTRVPLAMQDEVRFPVYVPTSGRRAQFDLGSSSCSSNKVTILAPAPSAVRSLAISGIDTSRVEDRPVAPSYFGDHSNNNNNNSRSVDNRVRGVADTSKTLTERPTRNGSCRYPHTNWMSQPDEESGHNANSRDQYNPHSRGLHNASSYILEDKLRRKATDEVRISKRGWNEEAVAERAMEQINFKKAKIDKRVAAKRQTRIDYEERIGAGM